MASVSGQEIHSTGNHNTTNFNEVLQSFAPYSKLYKELDWSDLLKMQSSVVRNTTMMKNVVGTYLTICGNN